ncbi:MAG: signal peptidase I [Parcubacteria group bacterium]|nr:signal peptidase I [Parcubacteria group bacterium]
MDSENTSENTIVPQGGVGAFVGEMVKVTLIALAIILPVRYFLIKPFYVNGASMEPSYFDREYLIIDEISYRFNEPSRGEVVVFKYPGDERQFFIKRVIGLPGERVVVGSGAVTVYNESFPDGVTLEEPYLAQGTETAGSIDVTLGADEYFVLGDNRDASLDSRRFGPLPRREIVGRTWLRGWPPDRVGVVAHSLFDF